MLSMRDCCTVNDTMPRLLLHPGPGGVNAASQWLNAICWVSFETFETTLNNKLSILYSLTRTNWNVCDWIEMSFCLETIFVVIRVYRNKAELNWNLDAPYIRASLVFILLHLCDNFQRFYAPLIKNIDIFPHVRLFYDGLNGPTKKIKSKKVICAPSICGTNSDTYWIVLNVHVTFIWLLCRGWKTCIITLHQKKPDWLNVDLNKGWKY